MLHACFTRVPASENALGIFVANHFAAQMGPMELRAVGWVTRSQGVSRTRGPRGAALCNMHGGPFGREVSGCGHHGMCRSDANAHTKSSSLCYLCYVCWRWPMLNADKCHCCSWETWCVRFCQCPRFDVNMSCFLPLNGEVLPLTASL